MTPVALTPKGRRWLRRWRQAKHLAGWLTIVTLCLATLALFSVAIAGALSQPRIHIPTNGSPEGNSLR